MIPLLDMLVELIFRFSKSLISSNLWIITLVLPAGSGGRLVQNFSMNMDSLAILNAMEDLITASFAFWDAIL